MPATTPHGYPYAEPTDPLVQWPATSQQLAEKIDELTAYHASGQIGPGDPISAATEFTVTFPPGTFTSTPVVILQWAGEQWGHATLKTLSPTGFTCLLRPLEGQTIPFVYWLAIEVPA
jgi:hypothetical protein